MPVVQAGVRLPQVVQHVPVQPAQVVEAVLQDPDGGHLPELGRVGLHHGAVPGDLHQGAGHGRPVDQVHLLLGIALDGQVLHAEDVQGVHIPRPAVQAGQEGGLSPVSGVDQPEGLRHHSRLRRLSPGLRLVRRRASGGRLSGGGALRPGAGRQQADAEVRQQEQAPFFHRKPPPLSVQTQEAAIWFRSRRHFQYTGMKNVQGAVTAAMARAARWASRSVRPAERRGFLSR